MQFFLKYLWVFSIILVVGTLGAIFWSMNSQLERMQDSLVKANTDLNTVVSLNKQYENALVNLTKEINGTMSTLSELKTKREVEHHYVREVQQKIIVENNTTCVDAVNAIFERLFKQGTTTGSVATTGR